MRVVTLTCSNTEIVCALGCGDRLVGVDNHSDYPQQFIAHLPRVGPDLGIDIERVQALRPDLVLASLTVPGHEKVIAGLEAAGLPYVATEPTRIEDIYADIRQFGELLGVPGRAQRLEESMRGELARAAPGPPGGWQPAILVEWWPKPVIVPGQQSWVTDLIDAAGGRNPLADRAVKSTPISDQEAIDLAPDAVVIAWCGVKTEKYRPDVVYRRPRWTDLPALRERRVFCVAEAYLGRPGPRVIDGYRALRQIVNACQA